MARRPDPCPKELAEDWRVLMSREKQETVFRVAWERVLMRFGVDLIDVAGADPVALYQILFPLAALGNDTPPRVAWADLDRRVEKVTGRPPRRGK